MSRQPSDLLLVLLTAVAASTDATSYLGLNEVFPANMTGNTVLLGISTAQGDFIRAGRSATALGAFVLGAACAGLAQADQPRRTVVMRGLLAEFAVLAAAAGWWLAIGDHPAPMPQHGLIALVAAAMGLQSATISDLNVGVTTTFITGTWTAVSTFMGRLLRRRPGPRPSMFSDQPTRRQALVLAVYVAAALLAGYLQHIVGNVAAALPLALVVAAVVVFVLDRPRP